MRLDGPGSSNFEDRTGRSGGGLGGGGGNLLGCLIPMIASRFGIGGVVVLVIGYFLLSSMGVLGGGGGVGPATTRSAPAGQSTLDPATGKVLTGVLGSTDQVWSEIFRRAGVQYRPAKMVAYSNADQSGCGSAQSAMGPFYCPTDQTIYIDPQFFSELSRRFQAPGDFAQGYVIAHEVGHHIQNLEGTLDRAQSAQARAGRGGGNAIQVGVELQADCYAGVWAANAKNPDGSAVLEQGDIEEGMRAAEAIGDDTLQRQTQGRVVPESFTHGSSAQRMEALRRGLSTGNPASCNYSR
ncbi:MAG: neutral zinc metallopeptidase [Sphingomicrobium sp.]